jgi:hypothetical protein
MIDPELQYALLACGNEMYRSTGSHIHALEACFPDAKEASLIEQRPRRSVTVWCSFGSPSITEHVLLRVLSQLERAKQIQRT